MPITVYQMCSKSFLFHKKKKKKKSLRGWLVYRNENSTLHLKVYKKMKWNEIE